MIKGEWLYYVTYLTMIILPIWCIVSVYNRRVKEIEKLREDVEKLREDVEKLKKDQRRE